MRKGGEGSSVNFTINGKEYSVNASTPDVDADVMLVDFIRDTARLKGTKVMCREGGCGACVVTVRTKDVTGKDVVKGVNSCITPVYSCQGWNISTVEDLGNKKDGYDVIQNRLVNFHGTQCGYCSPGMIMSMNSLMESKKEVTMQDVEDNFDGNICRCTGYRPILDAFKSLAVDATDELKKKCADIEDCASCPCPLRKGKKCGGKGEEKSNVTLQLANGSEWVTAVDLWAAFQAIQRFSKDGKQFRFVAGNTASGVYKHEGPFNAYLEINGIPELRETKVEATEIQLGGATTLTEAIALLAKTSMNDGFEYTGQISKHLERVANVPVRNNATIAGNLMIKHKHHEFSSDIFVILETAGAKLSIASEVGERTKVSLVDFLKTDMNGKLILSIHLPQLKGGYHYKTYKITRRYQNAHAYVNAGFLLKLDSNFTLLEKPRIVYGGINPDFIHASETEEFLSKNPQIDNEKVLQAAMKILDTEVNPDFKPPEATPEYRRSLTKSLLYKTVLGILNNKVESNLKSGGSEIPRGISKGTQVFDLSKSDSSLYKEIPKIEATWQVSGEAEYIPDIPQTVDELFAVFILSTIPCGNLKDIDASEALKMPGVVRMITAKDIKGVNNFMEFYILPATEVEPVFAEDKISYHGQALGLILAESRAIAVGAAKKVKVTYTNIGKPVVDIDEAYANAEKAGLLYKQIFGKFKGRVDSNTELKHTLKGEFKTGSQYHYHLETHTCLCVPKEDGIEVKSSTQYMDHTQTAVARALGIPSNSVTVQVRRIGGGFGGKASRAGQFAAACAIASDTVQKPVRLMLDLETNMAIVGKRHPYILKYEVSFDDSGKIGNLKMEIFCDTGFSVNSATAMLAVMHMQSTYKVTGWEITPGFLKTNTPANTQVRAPGSLQGVALVETVMEHIAHFLQKDSIEVRRLNFLEKGDPILPIFFGEHIFDEENLINICIDELKLSGDYEKRKAFVEKFNQENRWKKRGLSMVPMRYPIEYHFGCNMPAMVAIYHQDGHVACTHSGIEMGQGLNTKVIQTIAHCFQIPISKIKIKPTNNFVGANSFLTAATIASELVCFAVSKACEIVKARLKPILEKMENPSWEKLVEAAYQAKVDLTASYQPGPQDNLKGYSVWSVALAEVEIDVLTGEYKMVRTDLIEDAGKSMSPGVDIGQIEGGYIFGQGFWTTERIVHCAETGELLTNRTWDYKPPETKDIPEDFRITMLRNAPNANGILRSKATGEPILCATVVVLFALRNAIAAARKDKGSTEWFRIDAPVTPEDVFKLCLTTPSDLVFGKTK